MSEDQLKILERQLWEIGNALRGKVNADDYKDYILGFIFFKYLSEKLELKANYMLDDDMPRYDALTIVEDIEGVKEIMIPELGYFLQPDQLFKNFVLAAKSGNLNLDDLKAVFNYIENISCGTFEDLFEDIDVHSSKLGKTNKDRAEVISKVITILDGIDFKLEDGKDDILGAAYEYLIMKFASGGGKSAGEFYTPKEVSMILAKLVTMDKNALKSVYDPTCGSGSLLLRLQNECDVYEHCGQELTRSTYNMARMNMILHGIGHQGFDIKRGDTLTEPQHLKKKFSAIVANPPFSAHWKGKEDPALVNDPRFAYTSLAPKTKADFAFVQHMIYQLDDDGTLACVLPHGVLFRGSTEGKIRTHLIKEFNYLDAVIGLPANIFYGTSIPTCILVIKKCRKQDEDVVFIDASGEGNYQKDKNQNRLRNNDIEKIIGAYKERKDIDKYCRVVPISEIEENDFNLNIPRYVDTFEKEEPVNLDAVSQELKSIGDQLLDNEAMIESFCKELGISNPF